MIIHIFALILIVVGGVYTAAYFIGTVDDGQMRTVWTYVAIATVFMYIGSYLPH